MISLCTFIVDSVFQLAWKKTLIMTKVGISLVISKALTLKSAIFRLVHWIQGKWLFCLLVVIGWLNGLINQSKILSWPIYT